MKKVMDVMGYDVMDFAGMYKVFLDGKRIGGLYSTKEEARMAAIEDRRKYIGIVIRK